MDALNKLLDKTKKVRSHRTDMALAEDLGVTRAAVSDWRNERNLPGPVACARIAELTGEPLAKVLGVIGEARAISSAEKAVWRRLAAAACLMLIPALHGLRIMYITARRLMRGRYQQAFA